jgi:16S rRNA (uracil1498-N3)-methyltransferase
MARLFVEPERLKEDVLVLAGEDHRYLTRVLRLGVGDRLVLFDGRSVEADGTIVRVGPRALEVQVDARRETEASDRPDFTLLMALVKGDKMDFVVQKATELGVTRVIPVTTVRSIPRGLDASGAVRALGKRARWVKIAREGARQCGRADVPEVEPVTPLETALQAAHKDAFKLMLWEGAREHRVRQVLPPLDKEKVQRIVALVGPEGGFADDEVAAARAAGFAVAGLGPRILRTETAAVVVLTILGFAVGDLG